MWHSDWLLPGYAVQVKCGALYISSCSHQNHQFEPCFGVANQVAPLLRFDSHTSTTMAERADPVVETHYDTSTILLVISSVHTAGNNRKSVPAQSISSPRSSLHGSSTGGTKRGPLTTTPGNHPQLPFTSVPNHLCDSLSHR